MAYPVNIFMAIRSQKPLEQIILLPKNKDVISPNSEKIPTYDFSYQGACLPIPVPDLINRAIFENFEI